MARKPRCPHCGKVLNCGMLGGLRPHCVSCGWDEDDSIAQADEWGRGETRDKGNRHGIIHPNKHNNGQKSAFRG